MTRSGSRALLVGAALALTSCTGGAAVEIAGSDPVILTHRCAYSMQMHLEARLAYDPRSRCLRLEFRGGPSVTPVWPAGTRPLIHRGKRGVRIPSGGRVVEGDPIIAGGGLADWARRPPDGFAPPPHCLPTAEDPNVFIIGAEEPIAAPPGDRKAWKVSPSRTSCQLDKKLP